jgi:hypothetical protein
MESKVKFDLNANNESVIVAQIVSSDDVRDKIARRFYEGLGTSSNLALVTIFPETMVKLRGSESVAWAEEVRMNQVQIKTVFGDPESTSVWLKELCTEQLEVISSEIEKVLVGRKGKEVSEFKAVP